MTKQQIKELKNSAVRDGLNRRIRELLWHASKSLEVAPNNDFSGFHEAIDAAIGDIKNAKQLRREVVKLSTNRANL
jgi:hypothetical protein